MGDARLWGLTETFRAHTATQPTAFFLDYRNANILRILFPANVLSLIQAGTVINKIKNVSLYQKKINEDTFYHQL